MKQKKEKRRRLLNWYIIRSWYYAVSNVRLASPKVPGDSRILGSMLNLTFEN